MAACDAGESTAAVARRFMVSESFVEKLKRRRRETGSVAPKPHAGGRVPLLAPEEERLRAAWQTKPDQTLLELRDGLGLSVHLSTLWQFLRRLGLTFKKNPPGGGTGARRRAGPPRSLGTGPRDLGPGAPGVSR
jgi:transposase